MTLQDSIETIDQNLITFAQNLLPVIFLIFVFFLIIIFGFLAAYLIRLVINQISTILNLEKLFSGSKNYTEASKETGISFTSSIAQIAWWITLLIFIFSALDIVGLGVGLPVVSRLSAFLPSFTEAVLVLLIGSLFSYFVFSAASIFGKFSRFPLTNLLASTLAISVILFTLYQTLLVLRINEEIIRFLIIGIIAAFSLVVGLSGKEIITDYAKRIKKL